MNGPKLQAPRREARYAQGMRFFMAAVLLGTASAASAASKPAFADALIASGLNHRAAPAAAAAPQEAVEAFGDAVWLRETALVDDNCGRQVSAGWMASRQLTVVSRA